MKTTPSLPWTLERVIPSDTTVGSELAMQLIDAMQERGWSDSDVFRVQLAYEEAIVNSIRHGNRCDQHKSVIVKLHCSREEVRIDLADEGAGFDPSAIPDPRGEDLLEVPGGRGVLLISEIMSEVRYEDGGRRVIMVKRQGEAPRESEGSDLDE